MTEATPTLLAIALAVLCAVPVLAAEATVSGQRVERWGIFELALKGPKDGNPFVDVSLRAEFRNAGRVLAPEGFYDGDGVYRIRCMPDALGEWTFATKSNRAELDGATGRFTCVQPSKGNHGPVRVRNTVHLAYADG